MDACGRLIMAPRDMLPSQSLELVTLFERRVHADGIKLKILRWVDHFGLRLSEIDVELLAFKAVVSRHQVCGNLLQQSQKTNMIIYSPVI